MGQNMHYRVVRENITLIPILMPFWAHLLELYLWPLNREPLLLAVGRRAVGSACATQPSKILRSCVTRQTWKTLMHLVQWLANRYPPVSPNILKHQV